MTRMIEAAAESDIVNKMIDARSHLNNFMEKMKGDKNKDQEKCKELIDEAKNFEATTAEAYNAKHDDLKNRFNEL